MKKLLKTVLPFIAVLLFSCSDKDLPIIGVNEAGVERNAEKQGVFTAGR